MKPLKLIFSAFGPYATKQVLDFADLHGRSFFLIHGPTGAGKTTILDAICFALYGDSSGNLRDGKTMRSDHAGLGVLTEVEFSFSLGAATYKIWRSPEQERAKKRGEGTTISLADAAIYEITVSAEKLLATGYTNVTNKVEALLGFKSSQFRQVVLLPQGEFRKLLLANSLERQEIMQTLFKTDLYKRIEENLRQQAKLVKQAREELVTKREFILQELEVGDADALAAVIQADLAAQAASNNKIELLANERTITWQAVNAGKVVVGKFADLAAAELESKQCEALTPAVNEHKSIYQQAQAAQQLFDLEQQVSEYQADDEKNKQQLAKLQAEAIKINDVLEKTQNLLNQEQAKTAVRESVDRQLLELDALSNKAALLREAGLQVKRTEQLLTEQTKLKINNEKKLQVVQTKIKLDRQNLQNITSEAAQVEQYKLEKTKWQELQAKLKLQAKIDAAVIAARDDLAQATAMFEVAERSYNSQKTAQLRLQHLFAAGQAAILAKTLQSDCPCPVCGALTHPNPAKTQEILPNEAEIKTAQAKLDLADQERQKLQVKLTNCQSAYATANNRRQDITATIGDKALSLAQVKAAIMAADSNLVKAVASAKQIVVLKQTLVDEESNEQNLVRQQELIMREYQAADNARQAAKAIEKERSAALPEQYRDLTVLVNRQEKLQAELQTLKTSWEIAQKNCQQAASDRAVSEEKIANCKIICQAGAKRYQSKLTEFTERRIKAGFADNAAYQAAKKPLNYIAAVAERIKAFDERYIAAQNALGAANAAIINTQMPDMLKLQAAAQLAEATYNEAFAQLCRYQAEIKNKQIKQLKLEKITQKLQAIDEEYAVIGTLAEVANGGNNYGMTFQRFVLKSLLTDVLDAANLRLKLMSRGQYILQSTDDRARKNSAGGLEIEIFDHYTGYSRPVATLSGGETFLASLSLALGLADVVQSYAGGIHLDTILVDEGFGTLDPESLDIAIRALVDLQKGGRLVGIISHVPELKERIDTRLEVIKAKGGSSAHFCVG